MSGDYLIEMNSRIIQSITLSISVLLTLGGAEVVHGATQAVFQVNLWLPAQ